MNRHDLQKLAEAYTNVHEKKDSSYLETDMKKRQENNEKARKDMAKVKGQKNPHFEETNIRGNDSAKQKARLEKKRGMKLDDHPQFKKEEAEVEEGYGAAPGSGEKDQERTKKWMDKKGMKGAPGLDAMSARKKEHEEKRGVKKEGVDSLTAAYQAVYNTEEEVEQVDEDSRRTSNKQHTARVRSNIKSFGSDYTPPSNYDPDANRGKGEVVTPKQVEKKRRKSLSSRRSRAS